MTTITALLALHIETALDPSETNLARSMAQLSIAQTMLVLDHGKEIPVFKRALPIFVDILSKNGLYLAPHSSFGQLSATQLHSRTNDVVNAYASPHTPVEAVSPQFEQQQWETNALWDLDFLGFGFLDEWRQTG